MSARIANGNRKAPRLWRAFLVAAVIPFALIGISLWLSLQFEGVLRQQREVNRVYEQQAAIAALLSDVKDAETAQRGYIISGNRSFLEPYVQARGAVASRLARVEALYAGEPLAIRGRVGRISSLVPEKFDEMQRVIDVRDRSGRAAAAALVAGGAGKRLMDEIRAETSAIEQGQEAYLADQLAIVTREAGSSRQIYVLALLLLTGIAFIIAYVIWNSGRQRHRALHEAIEAGARQTAIFNSTFNAIILINPSGSIEVMNPAAERLFGYPATDLLRRDISIVADLAPGEGAFLDRIGLTDRGLTDPFRPLLQARRSNGELVPVEVALSLMPLDDGMHVVAVFSDVTEREKVEQIKDQFLSTVSHELRTPLTSIVGALGLLKAGVADELTGPQQHLADIAENNAHRLIRIVNDILDAEKLQSGEMTFNMATVDLCDVVRTAATGMTGFAATKAIRIEVSCPDEPAIAEGDAERLVQVVNNLVSNAVKFSPPDSRIDITLAREDGHARISVCDQGAGIPADLRPRLFTRFAQAVGSTVTGTPGTGLGLTIARDIVRHHGGTIGFADGPEGGTIFSFEIPIWINRSSIKNLNGAQRLLLYADGGEAKLLSASFAARSIRVDAIESVADAVSAVKQRRYLAMVVDFPFAGEDAPAMIQAVRAEPKGRALPIIGIAGEGAAYGPADTAAIDIIDWLAKPLAAHQLDDAIAAAMARAAVDMPVILHVDDDPDTLEVTGAALAGLARVTQAGDLASARAFLLDNHVDILIIDIALPDGSGLDLVTDLAETERAGTPVIIYTAQDGGGDLREVEAVLTKSKKTLPNLIETVLAIRERQEGDRDR